MCIAQHKNTIDWCFYVVIPRMLGMRGVYEIRFRCASGIPTPARIPDRTLTRSVGSPRGTSRIEALRSTVVEPCEDTFVSGADDVFSLRERGVTRHGLVSGSFRDCRVICGLLVGIEDCRVRMVGGIVSLPSIRMVGRVRLIAWRERCVASRHAEGSRDEEFRHVTHRAPPDGAFSGWNHYHHESLQRIRSLIKDV